MINSSVIMGRLTYEPELRVTPSGVSVIRFTVACERSYTPKGEERKTDFIDVVAWRQTAEFISKYFHKGDMIAVQGSIQTENYTDRDGNKRKSVEVVANNVSFYGSKAESNVDTNHNRPTPPTVDHDDFEEIVDDDDDLPF